MPPDFGPLIPIAGMVTGTVFMVLVAVGAVKVLQGPVGQALARRLRGGAPDPDLQAELAELREQVAALEQRQLEADERLDFAERMLAKPRETDSALDTEQR